MSIRAVVSKILAARRRSAIDAELGEEIDEHLRLAEEAQRAAGLSPDAARAAARREFGSPALTRQVSRESWGWPLLDDWLGDVRFGARVLRKHWASTAVAIGALGLAIGITTAVVSTLDTIVNARHPYAEPERLAMLWAQNVREPRLDEMQISLPELRRWQGNAAAVRVAGFRWQQSANVAVGNTSARARSVTVTANLFAVLGVTPAIGRAFSEEDERDAAANAAIITDAFWREQLGADPAALRAPLLINREPYAIVGVLPPGFAMPILEKAQLFVPMRRTPHDADPSARSILAIGRLVRGVSVATATAELDGLSRAFTDETPADRGQWHVNVRPLVQELNGRATRMLAVLLGLAAIVLLVACANVAILLLARIPARAHELAVRLALGAERHRVVRQLMVESALLAAAACVLGVLVAPPAVRVLVALLADAVPSTAAPAVDARAVAIAIIIAALTCLLFGVAPALSALRRVARGGTLSVARETGGVERARLRSVLVAAEVALSIVLAVGGWLMIENLLLVDGRDLGFDQRGLVTARLNLDTARYRSPEQQRGYFATLITRLGAHTELHDVSAGSNYPLAAVNDISSYVTRGGGAPGDTMNLNAVAMMPSYLAALHIPIVEGSVFRGDEPDPVVVIDDYVARHWWPNESAIGKRIRVLDPLFDDGQTLAKGERRIVGVSREIRHSPTIDARGYMSVFVPYAQNPARAMMVAVRAATPAAGAAAIREETHALDPMLPAFAVQGAEELRDYWTSAVHLDAVIMDSLAAIGVLLTLVGIYSVVAVFVSQRTREIGIRIAVGARGGNIIALVLRRTLIPAGVGCALGVGAALVTTRWLKSMLYGVSPLEPQAFAGAAVLLAVVVLAAAVVPARRAARLDPLTALRSE